MKLERATRRLLLPVEQPHQVDTIGRDLGAATERAAVHKGGAADQEFQTVVKLSLTAAAEDGDKVWIVGHWI